MNIIIEIIIVSAIYMAVGYIIHWCIKKEVIV